MHGAESDATGEGAPPEQSDVDPGESSPSVFDDPEPEHRHDDPDVDPDVDPAVEPATAPPLTLPAADTSVRSATMSDAAQPVTGAETWYRSDQDRFRSVRRRANPWYRRLLRGLIGLSFLAAAGIGLYFGARLVQDYLDRDKLPDQGVDVPAIRATSFELRSTAPAPTLDGTLTLDVDSGAFEFTGRGTGIQAGTQVVSPDGETIYLRRGTGAWQIAPGSEQVAIDVGLAATYLRNDDNADDILTSQLRRGYVDLIDRTELGEGDDELRRYELRLDTASFEQDFPLQFQEFEERAIPGVPTVRGLLVTITLDADGVLVGVDDTGTNWSWQRLSYSDQPFSPIDPAEELLDGTIEVTDGST